jgi:ComEC/Rec2-related protein
MNRPLVSVVIAYAAGLLLAQLFHPPPGVLLASAFIVLVLVVVLKNLRHWLIWPLLALLGWANFSVRMMALSPDDLRNIIGEKPSLVSVRGHLTETPSLRIYVRDDEVVERMVAPVRVTEIKTTNQWQPAQGDIVVTTPGVLGETFFNGQLVEIYGVLARPDRPVAEGIFDYRAYLEKLGVFYALKAESTNDWRLDAAPLATPPFSVRFIVWAKHTLTRGLDPADESTQLLLAMTLGEKTALNDEVSEPFMRSGTMHIFAISGLHIALIAGILLAVLRVVQLPRTACGLVVLPLIWFYTAATGWQSSAIRSTIMMSVIIVGWMLKRPSNLLNSLACAGLIILVWQPEQLFQASFQLSFFVVLSIALFSPPLEKIRDHLLQHDPLVPDELRPYWQRWGSSVLRVIASSLTTSLAAWLGSLPLTAFYFHLFSPVTLLANLIIVPLSSFALMANLGGILCGDWLPWFTEIFNNAAWFFMWLMVWLSKFSTKFPGTWMNVPAPSVLMVAIYFALLVAISSGWLFAEARRKISIVGLVLVAVIGVGCWQMSREQINLTVLPLNGSHAIYVDADGRRDDWLINCGNQNAAEFILKDFLRAKGVNGIPRLVLMEGSVHVSGGAQLLDETFGLGELWTSPVKFRSTAYQEILSKFEKNSRHKIFNCGEINGVWTVLFPITNSLANLNDSPLVLRGTFHNTKVLLLADLSRRSQSALLNRVEDLHADIVIAGLPDEGEPLCDALIEAIQPRVIVIADSEKPATRRARPALKRRLDEMKMPVIYTRESDAVTIEIISTGCKLRTMDGREIDLRQK